MVEQQAGANAAGWLQGRQQEEVRGWGGEWDAGGARGGASKSCSAVCDDDVSAHMQHCSLKACLKRLKIWNRMLV